MASVGKLTIYLKKDNTDSNKCNVARTALKDIAKHFPELDIKFRELDVEDVASMATTRKINRYPFFEYVSLIQRFTNTCYGFTDSRDLYSWIRRECISLRKL